MEMDIEVKEIAKSDIRKAMRKEIEFNQQLIENTIIYRNTYREVKIAVFVAMARNNALRQFLNLIISTQSPNSLKSHCPMCSPPDYLSAKGQGFATWHDGLQLKYLPTIA
jgi:hypothetical protein